MRLVSFYVRQSDFTHAVFSLRYGDSIDLAAHSIRVAGHLAESRLLSQSIQKHLVLLGGHDRVTGRLCLHLIEILVVHRQMKRLIVVDHAGALFVTFLSSSSVARDELRRSIVELVFQLGQPVEVGQRFSTLFVVDGC